MPRLTDDELRAIRDYVYRLELERDPTPLEAARALLDHIGTLNDDLARAKLALESIANIHAGADTVFMNRAFDMGYDMAMERCKGIARRALEDITVDEVPDPPSLEDIDAANIAKLKHRYPDKFTEDKAINRDLDSEREALFSSVFPKLPDPIKVIQVGSEDEDWEGYYVEGTLVAEGWSVDPIELLQGFSRALGIETVEIYDERPGSWFAKHDHRCPTIYPYDEDDDATE